MRDLGIRHFWIGGMDPSMRWIFPVMANLVEDGDTPMLSHNELADLGFKIAAYPLTLLEVAARSIEKALATMAKGGHPSDAERVSFARLRELVGFPDYYAAEARYSDDG